MIAPCFASGCNGPSGFTWTRLDHWLNAEDSDHPLQVVGENVKAHFRTHLSERAHSDAGLRPSKS